MPVRRRRGRCLLWVITFGWVGGRGGFLGLGLGRRGGGVGAVGWARRPRAGTSFGGWAERLASHAHEARCIGELSFWTGMLSEPSLLLVDGSLDPARDVMGAAGGLTLTLPVTVTEALLKRVARAFHAGINDVL